ncbi:MAG: hypothetical protein A2X42_06670 [Candidatus Margulisbacteria bacterium GWF2_38_17]|nr:MAG: hypothetical protein A2X43_11470 [Candidatus Margulisbacteria bacterium GWD2_39_127]OGI03733.1 MAG: hypothetical protein A2X42_06670 [Candidatus Margulisbacteria bacterium GWF2_38_17]OGI06853.1 MAG: hypothetical protein A2X41_12690 [Candidatus Margulisbacteria bacterium GWE2_39_32]
MHNNYALILAGGRGTRFWPKSKKGFPKQFLSLDNKESFLQITYNRIAKVLPEDNIYIVTTESQVNLIKEQLPKISSHQIIIEPIGRNTCPAISLGMAYIQKKNSNSVVMVVPSDQLIKDELTFVDKARKAFEYARLHMSIVVFGIKPTSPHTGYGYIKTRRSSLEIQEVIAFVEKPQKETAQQYLSSGDYYWNGGMFVFSTAVFFAELKNRIPLLFDQMCTIQNAIGTEREILSINNIYPQTNSISIDYGIMEHADKIMLIALDVGWNDVGSWSSLYEIMEIDEYGNNFQMADSVAVDSTNVIGFSNKLIAAVGVKDVVLVETDDVILLCHKDSAQKVKEVLDALTAKGRDDLI